jgi:ArsR family transcriptional regulator
MCWLIRKRGGENFKLQNRTPTTIRERAKSQRYKIDGLDNISVLTDMLSVTQLTTTAKALAEPTRIRVLASLRVGELCVCELCDALKVTQSTLSTHLQVIRQAGLVSTRKEGKWMYYALNSEASDFLETIFGHFGRSLRDDAVLRQDRQRLEKRMSLRTAGTCCVGFEIRKCCGK